MPAPAALLQAFGLSQGQVQKINRYYFYAENQERPLMEIYMSSDWTSVEKSYHKQGLIVSSTKNINSKDYVLFVYPNPISSNEILTVEFDTDVSKPILDIYNQNGQLINTIYSSAINTKSIQIDMNNNYNSGLYYYVLKNENKDIFGSGSFIKTN